MGEIEGVQSPVIKWAEANGWLVRRLQYIGRRGAPDAMFARAVMVQGFILARVLIFVEFKRRDGALAVQQQREAARLFDYGVVVHKIDTVTDGVDLLRREWERLTRLG